MRSPEGADPESISDDINAERFVYMFTSLVGRTVRVWLRDQSCYEGTFHSCDPQADYGLVLKNAHAIPVGDQLSGEIVRTLIIAHTDYVMVEGQTGPEDTVEGSGKRITGNFAIDAAISRYAEGSEEGEHALVAWQDFDGENGAGYGMDLEADAPPGARDWDQFSTNVERFGVMSTFSDDLYTTRLDPQAIPERKRLEAERIAREIESGTSHEKVDRELERQLDIDDVDEEARFASVPRHANSSSQVVRATDPGDTPQGARQTTSSSLLSGYAYRLPDLFGRSNNRNERATGRRLNALNLELPLRMQRRPPGSAIDPSSRLDSGLDVLRQQLSMMVQSVKQGTAAEAAAENQANADTAQVDANGMSKAQKTRQPQQTQQIRQDLQLAEQSPQSQQRFQEQHQQRQQRHGKGQQQLQHAQPLVSPLTPGPQISNDKPPAQTPHREPDGSNTTDLSNVQLSREVMGTFPKDAAEVTKRACDMRTWQTCDLPVVSVTKGINALNLEPTMPKLDIQAPPPRGSSPGSLGKSFGRGGMVTGDIDQNQDAHAQQTSGHDEPSNFDDYGGRRGFQGRAQMNLQSPHDVGEISETAWISQRQLAEPAPKRRGKAGTPHNDSGAFFQRTSPTSNRGAGTQQGQGFGMDVGSGAGMQHGGDRRRATQLSAEATPFSPMAPDVAPSKGGSGKNKMMRGMGSPDQQGFHPQGHMDIDQGPRGDAEFPGGPRSMGPGKGQAQNVNMGRPVMGQGLALDVPPQGKGMNSQGMGPGGDPGMGPGQNARMDRNSRRQNQNQGQQYPTGNNQSKSNSSLIPMGSSNMMGSNADMQGPGGGQQHHYQQQQPQQQPLLQNQQQYQHQPPPQAMQQHQPPPQQNFSSGRVVSGEIPGPMDDLPPWQPKQERNWAASIPGVVHRFFEVAKNERSEMASSTWHEARGPHHKLIYGDPQNVSVVPTMVVPQMANKMPMATGSPSPATPMNASNSQPSHPGGSSPVAAVQMVPLHLIQQGLQQNQFGDSTGSQMVPVSFQQAMCGNNSNQGSQMQGCVGGGDKMQQQQQPQQQHHEHQQHQQMGMGPPQQAQQQQQMQHQQHPQHAQQQPHGGCGSGMGALHGGRGKGGQDLGPNMGSTPQGAPMQMAYITPNMQGYPQGAFMMPEPSYDTDQYY